MTLAFCHTASSQVFDEKYEHWPVNLKINGTIVMSNYVRNMKPINELIKRSVPERDRVGEEKLIMSTLITDFQMAKRLVSQTFKDQQIHPDSGIFHLKNWDLEKIKKSISNSKIVFLYGNPLLAVEGARHSKEYGTNLSELKETLRQFIQRKGILLVNRHTSKFIGSKILLGEESLGSLQNGLNLIPDSIVETVYESAGDKKRVLSAITSHPRLVGVGIRKGSLIILRGRKIFAYETGSADFMLAANERQPLRIQKVGIPVHSEHRALFGNNLLDLTEWRRDAIDRTLPPFPPAEPRDPYVENGTLVIVGGGGMPQNLMQQLVEMAGGKEARMVYIPCAEQEDVGTRHRTVEYWKSLGVKSATFIHTKDRNKSNSDEEFLAPLKDATGLWFGGGRQWNFADSYYGTKAHKLMKDVLKRGGVIGGSSAGASIQARYLARATPIGNFRIMAPGYERGGLGFISGVAIDQHFTQRGRQKDMTQLMQVHPQLLGIGLDEATAIIVQKSKARVVGRGKVHFYDRNLPVFPDKPDFIALAAGSEYDLKSRKVLKESEPKKVNDTNPKSNRSQKKSESGKNGN